MASSNEQMPYDLLVIGGGINGTGIARDAAGRGLKVLLCEQNDLASGTSSASTKLIHGGLRYLEHYEFRLVREALIEREVLLKAAAHIIWPLNFVLPHNQDQRPAWMIRLGLFLYDHLGQRSLLPGSKGLDLRKDPVGEPLSETFTKGFSYADCWVQDARLVVLNAMDARERGAEILVGTRMIEATRGTDLWTARLQRDDGGSPLEVSARAIVNAGGPWVTDVIERSGGATKGSALRLVKGSHIVVPRLYPGPQAYIFQNDDKRVVFIIPYEDRFSLIGTTDIPVDGDPAEVAISEAEVSYLCQAVNRYLAKPIAPEQVVWSYSGVRPLYDDAQANASAVTRDYVFDLDKAEGRAPVLSIFGGKLTTYRKLAEHAMAQILPALGIDRPAWTRDAVLPGGDLPHADLGTFAAELTHSRSWLSEPLAQRFARTYGTRIEGLLGEARGLNDLGRHMGDQVYERELAYLCAEEWARSAEDVLWRRTKLGLHVSEQTRVAIAAWFAEHQPVARVHQAAQ